MASFEGHTAVIDLLIHSKDIDVNKPDKDGWTPLYVASRDGHTAVVELLIHQKTLM